MSAVKFTVVLNLSNFFSDHRHRSRICIDDRIKTVKDLHTKITSIFGIKNFILTSNNAFLPETEDISVVHRDDIIWVIPSNSSASDNALDTSHYIPSKIKKRRLANDEELENNDLKINGKKKKNKHSTENEDGELTVKKSKNSEDTEEGIKVKKHKKKRKSREVDSEEELRRTSRSKLKSLDYPVPKKHIGSKIKNTSLPSENNYINLNPPVNIATTSTHSIPCKKLPSVSQNTEKYLSEKKINIVKIDYIKKPTLQVEKPEEESSMELSVHQKQTEEESGTCSLEKTGTDAPTSKTTETSKDTSLATEIVSNDDKKTNKKSLYIPKTKYFFINTPSHENKPKSKPTKKRENFFKQKEGLFSPKPEKHNGTSENHVIDVKIDNSNKNEASNSTISPEDLSQENLSVQNNVTCVVGETSASQDQQVEKSNACETTVEAESQNEGNLGLTVSETYIDSSYINKSSPQQISHLNSMEVNHSTPSMSGITPFSFNGSKKHLSGVGQLLTSLRQNESNVSVEAINQSGEYVTKRRRRTRKRPKKSQDESPVVEETTSKQSFQPSISTTTVSGPKSHIKFSENDMEEHHEDAVESYSELSSVYNKTDSIKKDENGVGDEGSVFLNSVEERVYELPSMCHMLPKEGDLISFKMLKMSKDFTPEISSPIVGSVKSYSPVDQVVTFKIKSGVEQLQVPKGKFSLDDEEDDNSLSDVKEIVWSDLIEPKLIYP